MKRQPKLITNLRVSLPIRTVSEMNARENHWRRHERKVAQQAVVCAMMRPMMSGKKIEPPMTVSLTRVGPRRMDSDNSCISLKNCRDEIAKVLGVDDGDVRIDWRYDQRICKDYAVEVEIVAAPVAAVGGV